MLEGEYLELVDDLKKKFDEKEKEMEALKEENTELKKVLISAYGYIRILDYFAENADLDLQIKEMIDYLRSYLSDSFDNFFSL